MSIDVGVAPAEDKHVGIVVAAVHKVDEPHWQVELVHILSSTDGDPHAVANPHVQVPAVHVSEFPVHAGEQQEVVHSPVEQHNWPAV